MYDGLGQGREGDLGAETIQDWVASHWQQRQDGRQTAGAGGRWERRESREGFKASDL